MLAIDSGRLFQSFTVLGMKVYLSYDCQFLNVLYVNVLTRSTCMPLGWVQVVLGLPGAPLWMALCSMASLLFFLLSERDSHFSSCMSSDACFPIIVVINFPGSPSLDFFHLLCVGFCVWVPHSQTVLNCRANQRYRRPLWCPCYTKLKFLQTNPSVLLEEAVILVI